MLRNKNKLRNVICNSCLLHRGLKHTSNTIKVLKTKHGICTDTQNFSNLFYFHLTKWARKEEQETYIIICQDLEKYSIYCEPLVMDFLKKNLACAVHPNREQAKQLKQAQKY